ncbi:lectin-like domain-containing protein, partial [Fructobacillus cardui]|uniref:lectin-like domain-containing protein n=1 Tax=Fructobacillus cardui TaxID=2893170 RepID=UPI0030C841FA
MKFVKFNKVAKNFKMYKKGRFWVFASSIFLMGTIPASFNHIISFPVQNVASASTINSETRTVSLNQFNNYFQLNGSATQSTDGSIQLTPNQPSQTGMVSLKTRIDMNHDFTFKGQIYLGGGDGVAFGFADEEPGQIGWGGNAFGIGGLKNAFGIKLDTYYNGSPTTSQNSDGSVTTTAGPDVAVGINDNSNMDFITTSKSGKVNSTQQAAQINGITNSFSDLTITYSASTQMLSMTAQGVTLTVNIYQYINSASSYEMFIIGSNGGVYGLNKLIFNSFKYTIASDDNNNEGISNQGSNNSGDNNTGNSNIGSNNSGDNNTGNSNTGSNNSGDNNTGNSNTGSNNSGDNNTGNSNTGSNNSGDNNTGNSNTGMNNSGNNNSGNSNTGMNNSGNNNSGNSNKGSNNSGDNNTGNSNTGMNNSGNNNTGNSN